MAISGLETERGNFGFVLLGMDVIQDAVGSILATAAFAHREIDSGISTPRNKDVPRFFGGDEPGVLTDPELYVVVCKDLFEIIFETRIVVAGFVVRENCCDGL